MNSSSYSSDPCVVPIVRGTQLCCVNKVSTKSIHRTIKSLQLHCACREPQSHRAQPQRGIGGTPRTDVHQSDDSPGTRFGRRQGFLLAVQRFATGTSHWCKLRGSLLDFDSRHEFSHDEKDGEGRHHRWQSGRIVGAKYKVLQVPGKDILVALYGVIRTSL